MITLSNFPRLAGISAALETIIVAKQLQSCLTSIDTIDRSEDLMKYL
jgi:hypothetical protein